MQVKDVVKVKGIKSPIMVIGSISWNRNCTCYWFDEQDHAQEKTYPEAILEHPIVGIGIKPNPLP